ncbi:MAG TPA: hypothetical protein PKE62_11220 [Anaerolineales bacterium]|nr:hypothetical protein [Anaerolineales bacterium]
MKRADLIANLEATASALAGRKVTVRIRQPINEHARAETYHADGGRVVIDFSPEVFDDLRGFIRTFTHEAAHAKLHAADVPTKDITRPPASFKMNAVLLARLLVHPRISKRETEAETLAQAWRDAVRKRYIIATNTPASDENLIQVLRVLYGIGA